MAMLTAGVLLLLVFCAHILYLEPKNAISRIPAPLASRNIRKALKVGLRHRQALIQCVGGSSLQDTVARCLCADAVQVTSLPALTGWWQCVVHSAGPDPNMTDHAFDRLLARGLATFAWVVAERRQQGQKTD